jgi:hypothetical protein
LPLAADFIPLTLPPLAVRFLAFVLARFFLLKKRAEPSLQTKTLKTEKITTQKRKNSCKKSFKNQKKKIKTALQKKAISKTKPKLFKGNLRTVPH